jgi:hypothetical protein
MPKVGGADDSLVPQALQVIEPTAQDLPKPVNKFSDFLKKYRFSIIVSLIL